MQSRHGLIHFFFFFFNDTATTEIYTLSLHDALPISQATQRCWCAAYSNRRTQERLLRRCGWHARLFRAWLLVRSEEHTSELQSRQYLVCRLLLEKKKILRLCRYPIELA